MDERNEFSGTPSVNPESDYTPFSNPAPGNHTLPDPAADPSTYQSGTVNLSKPAAPAPSPKPQSFGQTTSGEYTFAQDPHSQPVQNAYTQPNTAQNAAQNVYAQPNTAQNTYGQQNAAQNAYAQPNTAQNTYGQQTAFDPNTGQQSNYSYGNTAQQQNPYNQQQASNPAMPSADMMELEKRAATVKTLGIVGLIISVVIGLCCCTIPGPVLGIIGLVKANGLTPMLPNLSAKAQNDIKVGRILCIIAIVISAISAVIGAIMGFTGSLESMLSDTGYY